jgi:hypothetical protein
MAESSVAPSGLRQALGLFPSDGRHRRDDQLGNPVAGTNNKPIPPKVYQDYLYLTPIVAVYGSGAVEDRHPVADGKAAARTDLALEAGGDGDRDTRWDKTPVPGFYSQRDAQMRREVKPHGACARGPGKLARITVYPFYLYGNRCSFHDRIIT